MNIPVFVAPAKSASITIKLRSMYTMVREGVELTPENRIVTLSTCVANKPNNRRLLQAVFVEEIEAEYRGTENEATEKAQN